MRLFGQFLGELPRTSLPRLWVNNPRGESPALSCCTKNVRFRYTLSKPSKRQQLRIGKCSKTHFKIKVSILDKLYEFWYCICSMSNEQKKSLLKAKVAVALQNELGRVPKEEEIEQVTMLARVMYKAVLGLHYKRKEQKKSGQLAIF